MWKKNTKVFKFLLPLIDFIYPRNCFVCNKFYDNSEEVVCDECFQKLKDISKSRNQCYGCGMDYEKCQCSKLENRNFTEIYSVFNLTPDVSKLIHDLKYRGYHTTGKFLTDNFTLNKNFFNDLDMIVPVPLHFLKRMQRGYNQAEIIGRSLSEKFNIPLGKGIVKRKKYTKSQTKLSREERSNNMRNVFIRASDIDLSQKRALIVDDIITTTATTNECASVLKNLGCVSVKIFSLARA